MREAALPQIKIPERVYVTPAQSQRVTCYQIFLTQNLKKVQSEHLRYAGAWFYWCHQRTQNVPNEDQIKILIDPTVLAQVDAVCPSYLTPCDKMGITETLAGSLLSFKEEKKLRAEEINQPQAAKVITSNAREAKPKNQYGKRLDPEVIPAELQDCSDQIIEFWAVKKGTRSEGAATRLFNKLRVMGPSARIAALHAATDAGWSTVYEPKTDTPTQSRHNHQAEPEFKHPAHQVFTAADFE
jgi:hypothetical protein